MMPDFEGGCKAVYGVASEASANFKKTQYSVTNYTLLLLAALVMVEEKYLTSVVIRWPVVCVAIFLGVAACVVLFSLNRAIFRQRVLARDAMKGMLGEEGYKKLLKDRKPQTFDWVELFLGVVVGLACTATVVALL